MLRMLLPLVLAVWPLGAQTPPPAQTAPEPPPRTLKSYALSPAELKNAIAYERARNRVHFVGAAWTGVALLLLLATRVGPRVERWVERVSGVRLVQAYLFTPLLLLVVDTAGLPTELYSHRLALQYQESVQGWGSWFWDWSKGEMLEFLLTGFLAWMFYSVIRRSPRRWWFYFWLLAVPVELFLNFIEPVVVEPMFYHFEPLAAKHPDLVAEIGKVVARGGLRIPPDRMFEMKASEKVTSLNASVQGLGASKRVVVWDTTIREMTTPEILFVFGHEMGHYVLRHNLLQIAAVCGVMLVFLYVGYHATGWILARWGGRLWMRGMDSWGSMPLMILVVSVLGFVSEPVMNSFSRVLEHNADRYGLEAIHGIVADPGDAAARAFHSLGNLSDPTPSPFIEIWLYDHPPIGERERFALEYNPWGPGQSPTYVK